MPMRSRTTLTLTAAAVLSITTQIAQADEQESEVVPAENSQLVVPSTTALAVVTAKEDNETSEGMTEAEEEVAPEIASTSEESESPLQTEDVAGESEDTSEIQEAEEELQEDVTPVVVDATEEPESTTEAQEAEEEVQDEAAPLVVDTPEEPEATDEAQEAEEETLTDVASETITVPEEDEPESNTVEVGEEVVSSMTLEIKGDVFGIPFYGNETTDPAMLRKSMDAMKSILDQNADGQADKPELVQYMADNNYRVVVANSPDDLNDSDGFDDATTAEIFSQSFDIDGEVFENLQLVAGAQYSLLKKKAQEYGDLEAQEKLAALNQAIAQLKENGLSAPAWDDEEIDDDDIVQYLVFSELTINGQLPSMLERFSTRTINTIKAIATLSPKDVPVSEEEEAQVLPEYLKAWTSVSSESFQEKNPLICAWLHQNSLSAPLIPLRKVDLSADEGMIKKIASLALDDVDDSEETTQNTGI